MATSEPRPPGTSGLPLLGETLAFMKDMFGFIRARTQRHGPVFAHPRRAHGLHRLLPEALRPRRGGERQVPGWARLHRIPMRYETPVETSVRNGRALLHRAWSSACRAVDGRLRAILLVAGPHPPDGQLASVPTALHR
jgi:hypothetical protein